MSYSIYSRFQQRQTAPSASLSPAPPLGQLIETINQGSLFAKDYEDEKLTKISNVEAIASYNWVNDAKPKIIIPGTPPRWTPVAKPRRLPWDSGVFYRDINSASYPKHPLEPAIVSILRMCPQPLPVDVVACGSTIGNLLRFVSGVEDIRPFRILVEVIGNTVHLVRRENSPKEVIPEVKGYGHTFPEANTTWDADVRRSKSHQRILKYRFGGLDMIVRFEGDGYIKSGECQQPNRLVALDEVKLGDLSDLGIGEKPSGITDEAELNVTEGGYMVSQDTIFDLKTRSIRVRDKDILGDQMPRLWIAQVQKFILAFHERGLFEEIEIKDVKTDLEKWERANQARLAKLVALLHHLIDRVIQAEGQKLEIVFSSSKPEVLELRKQMPDAGDMLSSHVREKWAAWLDAESLSEDGNRSIGEGDAWYGVDEKHGRFGPSSDDGFGNDLDFTACDKECGYCGKCDYSDNEERW